MTFKKGQAALDFLMTYGWAIALVVIVAAALFALGVFDMSNFVGSKAAGFSGVAVSGWRMDPAGTFTIKVSNQVGQPINVTAVTVIIGVTSFPVNVTGASNLGAGVDSATLTSAVGVYAPATVGSGYTAKVNIEYVNLATGFQSASSGTLTGKIA